MRWDEKKQDGRNGKSQRLSGIDDSPSMLELGGYEGDGEGWERRVVVYDSRALRCDESTYVRLGGGSAFEAAVTKTWNVRLRSTI